MDMRVRSSMGPGLESLERRGGGVTLRGTGTFLIYTSGDVSKTHQLS